MRHFTRSSETFPWERGGAEPGHRGQPPVSPAIVTMVRHRIATGFYDTPAVKRAICEGVLGEQSSDPGLGRHGGPTG